MVFGIKEESSRRVEPDDIVKKKTSLVKLEEWSARATIPYIADKLNKIIEYYDYIPKKTKIGIAKNDYGLALLERLRRKFSVSLYKDPAREEEGVYLDNIKGLLQDLEEIGKTNPVFFTDERKDIFKMVSLQGGNITPERYEAYILALAGACKMFKYYRDKAPIPSTPPKWKQ
jgi:hypothetical protein